MTSEIALCSQPGCSHFAAEHLAYDGAIPMGLTRQCTRCSCRQFVARPLRVPLRLIVKDGKRVDDA